MSANTSRHPAAPRVDRPDLPASYGIQPAASGEGTLAWDYVSERMHSAHNYWLVTSRRDGRPHAVPLWGVWVDEAFFFSTDAELRKARNLRLNLKAGVHLESGDEVVILEGRADVVQDASLQARLDSLYFAKYGFHMEGGPIFRVSADTVLAWRERDFPSSATRFRLSR